MNADAIDLTLDSIRPDRQLHYENFQVLMSLQALCGGITANMLAVSITFDGPAIDLHFYLERESAPCREEIDDAVTELDALQFARVPIRAHVTVVGDAASPVDYAGRPIYLRHRPPD